VARRLSRQPLGVIIEIVVGRLKYSITEIIRMNLKLPHYRLFIIGAGFSKPAGYPIGTELLSQVREYVRLKFRHYGWEGPLEQEIQEWCNLYPDTPLSLESVIAYSHRKHFLGLIGSEERFSHGSFTVVAVRQAIQDILTSYSHATIPPLYIEFVKRLTPYDTVFTFNYDTLLEDSLELIGKPFSLTPEWWLIEDDEKEYVSRFVDIIKLHGSIDWYDKNYHEETLGYAAQFGITSPDRDPIFGDGNTIAYESLARGELKDGMGENLCSRIFRIPHHRNHVSTLVGAYNVVPFLLPPAFDKILGHDPIRDLWKNMHRTLDSYSDIIVIGYSMPVYDSYAYEALGQLIFNYQKGGKTTYWEQRRAPVQIITYSPSKKKVLNNLPFLKPKLTKIWRQGFSLESLNWIDWGN
jgi:hypothetical protein